MILMPASLLSAATVAVTCVFAALPPFFPIAAFIAIAKHAACAAAISSSGLVLPPASPIRFGNVTGRVKAPLPALAVPLPSISPPSQSVVTLRSNVAMCPPMADLKVGTTVRLKADAIKVRLKPDTTDVLRLCFLHFRTDRHAQAAGEAKLNEHAEQPDRRPRGKNPAAAWREIEWIHHPYRRPRREAAARVHHAHRAPEHRPSARKGRRDDDDVTLQPHRRRRARHGRENDDKRMRVVSEPAPDHVDTQRADAGADEGDPHEVPEEHDQRAHGATAERGKNQHCPIARTEHRGRSQSADVEPEQREHETEKTVARSPGNDA